jgi:RND family efflux transporter MFP subunit
MDGDSRAIPLVRHKRRRWILLASVLLIALSAGVWSLRPQGDGGSSLKEKKGGAMLVVSAVAAQRDVAVRLTANGTVSAIQAVEVRPQISATVNAVHIKEGQYVRQGDRLFTLNTHTEDANLIKSEAQLLKDRADLANAERNLERQKDLFRQKFNSQIELDTAQNLVDGLRGQLAVDQAAVETSRVAQSFGQIMAPIAGRTGAISIYQGSLAQPNGAALVSITQIAPINVSFALPERELAGLQQAFNKGEVPVSAALDTAGKESEKGRLVFIDNAVDTASGTIRLKAEFLNADKRLWPGMFVTVTLAPRTLTGVVTVPAQAVQTGPERSFVYVVGEENKVAPVPVTVRLIQDGLAVIDGIAAGVRVVGEGAQNLRPGTVVDEAKQDDAGADGKPGKNTKKKAGPADAQSSRAAGS